MQVGDMVTLSAAAQKRDTMHPWCEFARTNGYGKPKPVGIVVEIKPMHKIGFNSSEKDAYVIKWITSDPPKSRDYQFGYYANQYPNQFWRTDLKFVSKRKRSKK